MKKLKKVFVVLFISIIGLWGCEDVADPIDEYFALTQQLNEKTMLDTACINDDKKFNETIIEIEKIIDDSSKKELRDKKDRETQKEITKTAQDTVQSIKDLRPVIIKFTNQAKKGNLNLILERSELLDKFNNNRAKLYEETGKLEVSIPDNERSDKLFEYETHFIKMYEELRGVAYDISEFAYGDYLPSDDDIKAMNKRISTAKTNLAKLEAFKVDEKDRDVKAYKEKYLKKIINNCEKDLEYQERGDLHLAVLLEQENDIYKDKALRIAYYNILVKPYLTQEKN